MDTLTRPTARPCGTFERWYISRSLASSSSDSLVHAGFNLALHPTLSLSSVRANLQTALRGLQTKHSWLTARVSNYDGDSPRPEICLTEGWKEDASRPICESVNSRLQDALERELGKGMSLSGPLWRAIMVAEYSNDGDEISTVYVGVTIHHLLADGLATLTVARSLVTLLDNLNSAHPQTVLKALPIPLEEATNLRPSLSFIASTIYKVIEPKLPSLPYPFSLLSLSSEPPSTAFKGRIATAPPHPRAQHLHLVSLSIQSLQALSNLTKAHRKELTVTSAFHTLITLALLPLVEASSTATSQRLHIESAIPMSLLPLFASSRWKNELGGRKYGPEDGGVYAAPSLFSTLTQPSLSSYTNAFPPNLESFLALTSPTTAHLHRPTARAEAAEVWGLIGWLSSAQLRGVNERNLSARDGGDMKTFLLSNLGKVAFDSELITDDAGGNGTHRDDENNKPATRWVPAAPVFAVPVNGLGAALVCGLVTSTPSPSPPSAKPYHNATESREAGLNYLSLVWEEGVFSRPEVEGIAERIARGLERLVEWSTG